MAELVKVLSDIDGWLSAIFFALVAIEVVLIFKDMGGRK